MKLKKKYIKAAKGNLKKAWRMQRGGKKPKARTRSTRRVAKKTTKRSRNMSKGMFSGKFGNLLAAAAYGAVRGKISNALAPVAARVPAGEISDEVVMMGVNLLAEKALPAQFREAARQGQAIEAARLGDFLASRGLQGLSMKSSGEQLNTGLTATVY